MTIQKPSYQELENRITELEKNLTEGEKRFKLLYERAPLPYQSLDKNGNIIEVNPAWLNVLGYTYDEVIGKNFSEFLPSDMKAHFKTNFPRFKAVGEILGIEFEIQKKDGSFVLASFHGKIGKNLDGGFKQTHCIFHDITLRRQTEQDLWRTKRLLNDTQELGKVGGWEQDLVQGTNFWTDNQYRVFGYEPGEINDKHSFFLNTIVHPKDRNRLSKLYDTLLTEKKKINTDFTAICKDGTQKNFHGIVVPELNHSNEIIRIYGTNIDITATRESENALRLSHERFLTVLDSIDASIYVLDMKTYEILFMNRHMIDSLGEDMMGKICWESYRKEKQPCSFCKNKDLIDDNNQSKGVCTWQGKNPVNGKWYINYDRAIQWTDGRLVKIQIATDITELKKMEEDLRQAQKMESVGTLAGGIAHDFNNILGIILGNAELALADTVHLVPTHENIQEIKTASLRARSVVKQLLSFSRKNDEDQKPIELLPLIKDSLKLLRATIPSTIEIKEIFSKEKFVIQANATQVHQVMLNICNNASHAMEQAGGILSISVDSVTIDQLTEESREIEYGVYVRIKIKDTGTGIDPEIQDKIFDPYFTTKEIGKGTGMGLAVVHGIIKNHNGYIMVDSQLGHGTQFTILLPLVDEMIEKQTIDKSKKHAHGNETILLIDDEKSIVDVNQQMLGRLGYKTHGFTQPLEAFQFFKENPDIWDLVITDLTMPKLDGLELSKKIHKINPELPILICTGDSQYRDLNKNSGNKMISYVMKPVPMSKFSKIIRQTLDSL